MFSVGVHPHELAGFGTLSRTHSNKRRHEDATLKRYCSQVDDPDSPAPSRRSSASCVGSAEFPPPKVVGGPRKDSISRTESGRLETRPLESRPTQLSSHHSIQSLTTAAGRDARILV